MPPLKPPLSLLICLLVVSCSNPSVDVIITDGYIWTANSADSLVEAIAVTDGRITATGSTDEIEALAGQQTQRVSLDGAFALPGFIDTHIHMASAARFLEFNIMRTATQGEFVQRVEEVVNRLPAGEWILGGLWGAYDQWVEGSAGQEEREPFVPDISLIETLTQHHPVFIRKFDNSAFAANQAAMTAANLDPSAPAPAGVTFGTDEAGNFNGLLFGVGVTRVFEEVIPDFTKERRKLQTLNAMNVISENGVTLVSDMSDDLQLEIYQDLLREGMLTSRVEFRYPLDRWSDLATAGHTAGSGDDWIRLGSLKGHIDGIMGSSSARFFVPYSHDPTNRGRWRRLMVNEAGEFVEGQFLQYMKDADAAGLQMTIHAIGDEANRLLMDYLDSLNVSNGEKDRRFRLVHAQVIAPGDFERLGRLDIIAEVQPFHLSDDMRWMEERIGYARSKGAYAFKSIAESGAKLSFGSDWPGTSASEYPINPLLGVYAAVTRQTLTGQPADGWFPNERIGVESALRAYTIDAAYAVYMENDKGSIEPGKLADLTVLSANPFEVEPAALLDIETLYTIVHGNVVYAKE